MKQVGEIIEEIENEEIDEDTGEQHKGSKRKKGEWLAPWQFKPGQSGNPSGRTAKGESMKEYAKRMLAGMTPKQRQEFLKGVSKHTIWEMAEGKAKQGVDLGATDDLKEYLLKLNKLLG